MTASPVLVTGGTGTLGRLVVERLLGSGAPVRVLARRRPDHPTDGVDHRAGDLASGTGVAEALDGVRTVIHCAGSAHGDEEKARHLVDAARVAGVGHVVYISVVGADRIPVVSAIDRGAFGYYAAKLAAERVISGSGIPWTTLRATQFHDFVLTGLQTLDRLPVLLLPRSSFQPVDAREVADRLVGLAAGAPVGRVADLGGPRVYEFAELARDYQDRVGRRKPILRIGMPGRAAKAMAAGANLAPEHATGTRTWEEFLAERVPAATGGRRVTAPSAPR